MGQRKRHPALADQAVVIEDSTPRALPTPEPAPAGTHKAGTYDPDPPTPEEVAEAYRFKYEEA